jgi:hypothetical protein
MANPMSMEDDPSKDAYYSDPRVGRKPQPGDDDVNPWKFYGMIGLMVVLAGLVVATMFLS